MEKKTKKEMFSIIRAGMADNAEVVAFCDHELELLAKKNSAERKPTVNQLDNAKIKRIIVDGMESGKGYTVTEIIKTILAGTEWHELTCSRCTAIVTQLTESGTLVRNVEKRKAYYSRRNASGCPSCSVYLRIMSSTPFRIFLTHLVTYKHAAVSPEI